MSLLALRATVVLAMLIWAGQPAAAAPQAYGQSQGRSAASVLPSTPISSASASPAVPAGMRVVVRFAPTATESQRAEAVHSVNGWIDAAMPALGLVRVALPGGSDDAVGDGPAVAAFLQAQPGVASAEFDASVRLDLTPNDPLYLADPYTGLGQWGIRRAQVDKAWDIARALPTVVVATLDTGVDPDHPDLQGAIVAGTTFVSQPSTGCAPDSKIDDDSHGTHVAGIIAANGNNGVGISGVAFGAKVMPVKVLDCTGSGSLSDVAQGLIWATDHGAKIVNISLGSSFDSGALRSAVTYATSRNVLVVSAAGNCGTSGPNCSALNQLEYPAAYPDVLCVGATDTDDTVAFFSSRNSAVDVSAPGRRIVSTMPTYKTYQSTNSGATLNYGQFSGTSQASPFVAGLAALIWSAQPSLTAQQVFQRIEQTADDLGDPGRDDGFGFGRVNGLKALSGLTVAERYAVTYDASTVPTSVATGKPFGARVALTNTSSFAWSAAQTILDWSWLDISGRPVAGISGALALPSDVAVAATVTASGTITAPPTAGPYTLRLDLDRGGVQFSTKAAAPATLAVVVGSGLGAAYAPATAGTASFDLGVTGTLGVALTNTGTVTWPAAGANPVHVSYHWLQGGQLVTWEGLRATLPGDVPSGTKLTVALPVMPPATPGSYTLRIDLVQEGVSWFSGSGIIPLDLVANVRSAYVATYAAGTPPILLPGGRTQLAVTVTNTGTVTWPATGLTPVHAAVHVSDGSGNTVIWDGARAELPADVAPGAKADIKVLVDAPLVPGAYRARVDLVREGVAWFSSLGIPTADVDLLVAPDFRASIPGGPITVSRANPVATVAIKNTGVAAWTTGGAAPVDVAVHWYDAFGAVVLWDGPRTALPAQVGSNETVTVTVKLGPPPAGGAFVAIDLVSEGIAWFGQGSLRLVTLAP